MNTWSRMAAFSYTLYLFHQPPLAFANAWLTRKHYVRWQPTALHVLMMLTIAVVVILYAYAGSRVTEVRTNDLRSALQRLRRQSRLHPASAAFATPF